MHGASPIAEFKSLKAVVTSNLGATPDDIRLSFSCCDTISPIMARRPRPPDEVLNSKDLAELQRCLSMMSVTAVVTAVQDFYRSAHSVCRIGPGHFPSARAIQELV